MYQIWKNKLVRKRTEYIIISQAINTRDNKYPYFDNSLIKSNLTYTWGKWQEYYMQDLKKRMLPCHYYVELLDRDYVVYKGLAEEHPSYFIDELVSAGVIKPEYKHALFVTIGENYNIDIPEYRMYEHLAEKCLVDLLRRYKLNKNRIMYIDEILTDNWQEMLKTSSLNYDIQLTQFFDRTIMEQHINFYKY